MAENREGSGPPEPRHQRGAGGMRHFGEMLRQFRESYYERVRPQRPDAPSPRLRLSALSLIKCLAQAGYSVSSGAYSEIEAGKSIPREPRKFVDAVAVCLELTAEQKEALTRQLGYDIVYARLGDFADLVFGTRDE
jgi:hypothetical protein